MRREEFLTEALPPQGYYCVARPQGGTFYQSFVDSVPQVSALADELKELGKDVYIALASFSDNTKGRTVANTHMFKSLWIDLDVGDKTAYANQEEAVFALKRFVRVSGLPVPSIISSGYGLHIYWHLSESIDYNEWKPLARALQSTAIEYNFSIKDPGIMTDGARILRVPGTINFKRGEQRPVKLLHLGKSYLVEDYKTLLKVGRDDSPVLLGGIKYSELNETTRALLGNTTYKFSSIMRKSIKGSGCDQLKQAFLHQEDTPEPLWRAALSIAAHCVDKDTAIHAMSKRHPEYSPEDTIAKAALIKGPYLCSSFRPLNPSACSTCVHYTDKYTPLLLGEDILEATLKDNVIDTVDSQLGNISIEIPLYPFPYFRGPMGGVYIKEKLEVEGEDGEEIRKLVYEYDFYVVGRRTDPEMGEVLHIRLIRPHDGIHDFTAPLATLTAQDKCRDMLSQMGIAAGAKQMQGLMAYLVCWTKYLQNTSSAEKVRTQFGWVDIDKSFIIGTRELNRGMPPQYSPPSETTRNVADIYRKEGTLEGWQPVANSYAVPGNEGRAFALFLSLGAPMFKVFSLGGAILHLTNASSGVGKSTVQAVANSVWGHPIQSMLTRDDTTLAKYHRMGVVQNMILCIDELTNLPPEEISNLAFGATNGRGRNRMMAATNSERVNNTTWSLPCITSGNNSLHNILQSLKADPEGEIMRVIELQIDRTDTLTKMESDELFSRALLKNYGHAGEAVMQYILDNYEECLVEIFDIQKKFDQDARLNQRERYYSALCATALFGGMIANRIGIIDIPVVNIHNYLVSKFGNVSREVASIMDNSYSHLGLFMAENIDKQIIMSSAESHIAGLTPSPIVTPRGGVVIRVEPKLGHTIIQEAALKTWCAKRQVSFDAVVQSLKDRGSLVRRGAVKMMEGTAYPMPAVKALVVKSDTL